MKGKEKMVEEKEVRGGGRDGNGEGREGRKGKRGKGGRQDVERREKGRKHEMTTEHGLTLTSLAHQHN